MNHRDDKPKVLTVDKSDGEVFEVSLDHLLNRYVIVHGEGRIWDSKEKSYLKLRELKWLFSPTLVSQFLEHPQRRIIDKSEIGRLKGGLNGQES